MVKRLVLGLLMSVIGVAAATAPPPKRAPKDLPVPPWRKMSFNDLRIQVEESTEKMDYEQVVIYGNGAAVWNDKEQFRLTDLQIARILTALDKAGFDKLKSVPEGEHLRRRVRVRAGEYEHEVAETWEVEQERKEGKKEDEEKRPSVKKQTGKEEKKNQEAGFRDAAKLETLVDSVFKIVKPIPEKTNTADSLTDGLKKIAAGELAPETLSFMMMVKPEGAAAPGMRVDGFLMRIDGGVASSSEYLGDQKGFAPPARKILDAKTLREIASKLAANDVEALPGNLYADRYVEMNVRVLKHRRNLTARKFAGMTPEKLGAAQKQFDATAVWLQGLQRHWFQPSQEK